MRKAYLGIAGPCGLHLLVPETTHAATFLVRRAERLNAVCFWTVIDDAFCYAIRMELEHGESANALRLLQFLADEMGTILPSTFTRETCLTGHEQCLGTAEL